MKRLKGTKIFTLYNLFRKIFSTFNFLVIFDPTNTEKETRKILDLKNLELIKIVQARFIRFFRPIRSLQAPTSVWLSTITTNLEFFRKYKRKCEIFFDPPS